MAIISCGSAAAVNWRPFGGGVSVAGAAIRSAKLCQSFISGGKNLSMNETLNHLIFVFAAIGSMCLHTALYR
jgi:hypothetical protein